jgi:hypothetical protein
VLLMQDAILYKTTGVRMNWKSFTSAKGGKLPRSMVIVLPKVMFSFLSEMDSKQKNRFTISELSFHIRNCFPDIEPIVSKIKSSEARKRFPEKKILDIQNSCYHLAREKSFWIEDVESGNRITLFEHPEHPKGESIENVIYIILPNWKNYF